MSGYRHSVAGNLVISAAVPRHIVTKLRKIAKRHDWTLSAAVREALREWDVSQAGQQQSD